MLNLKLADVDPMLLRFRKKVFSHWEAWLTGSLFALVLLMGRDGSRS
jgi:hypothetical protein